MNFLKKKKKENRVNLEIHFLKEKNKEKQNRLIDNGIKDDTHIDRKVYQVKNK